MDKEKLREVVYIVMAVLVAVLVIKLVIWLLPVVLIVMLALFIYGSMKRNGKREQEEVKKSGKTKNKRVIIIDEESQDD